MPESLLGKVAVVSGGASGIGAAVVTLLEQRGAAVVVADLQGSPVTDVASSESVAALATRVAAEHGGCDFLVNCAAVVEAGSVLDVSEERFRRSYEVNVLSILRTTQHLAPLMTPGAAIVNVASAAGLRPIPELAAYIASKSAVIGLTGSMAIDLAARGIRVNCVCPGLVDTPMARQTQSDRTESTRQAVGEFQGYLVRRFATPDEVAEPIIGLLTNGYITGSTLAVDGGRSLH